MQKWENSKKVSKCERKTIPLQNIGHLDSHDKYFDFMLGVVASSENYIQ